MRGAIDGAPVIVSGGADKTIRRWNARTGEPIGEPLEGAAHIAVAAAAERTRTSIVLDHGHDNHDSQINRR